MIVQMIGDKEINEIFIDTFGNIIPCFRQKFGQLMFKWVTMVILYLNLMKLLLMQVIQFTLPPHNVVVEDHDETSTCYEVKSSISHSVKLGIIHIRVV